MSLKNYLISAINSYLVAMLLLGQRIFSRVAKTNDLYFMSLVRVSDSELKLLSLSHTRNQISLHSYARSLLHLGYLLEVAKRVGDDDLQS